MIKSRAFSVTKVDRPFKPLVSRNQGKKIIEINTKLQNFLINPAREKIYLEEPGLKINLLTIMNPNLFRLSVKATPRINLKKPFIHYPVKIYTSSNGYQFVDHEVFSKICTLVRNKILSLPNFRFWKVEVEEFIKQASAVIEQIERGKKNVKLLVKRRTNSMNWDYSINQVDVNKDKALLPRSVETKGQSFFKSLSKRLPQAFSSITQDMPAQKPS